jgi:hypothetical protein
VGRLIAVVLFIAVLVPGVLLSRAWWLAADRRAVAAAAVEFAVTSEAGAAALTPVEQMLVETDAPFLTPMPHRGRPNASRLVPHTVRALAEVTGVELEELCSGLTRTAERVFGSWR